MESVTTRWEVEKAVLWSNLKPSARLLVLTLLVKADNETAIVPPEHSPSLTTLQAATGLSRSAVTEHLAELEEGGWVKRSRPATKGTRERTGYALCVPTSSPPEGLVHQEDYSTSAPDGLDRETDQSPPAAQQTADSMSDSSSPPGGHATTNTTTHSSTKTSGSRGGTGGRGSRIPDDFWPDASMIAWARQKTPNVGIAETEAFIDWAKSTSGAVAAKLDWKAAWRNWMRRAQRDSDARLRRGGPQPPPSAPPKVEAGQECTEHPGRRKDTCGLCRAARLGKAS